MLKSIHAHSVHMAKMDVFLYIMIWCIEIEYFVDFSSIFLNVNKRDAKL